MSIIIFHASYHFSIIIGSSSFIATPLKFCTFTHEQGRLVILSKHRIT